MTHRDRILAALRHEPLDGMPWVPRLDLWYNAHRYRGTLPAEWRDASLMEIVQDLGVGYHAVVPDFLDTEEPEEVYDRLLGLDHVRNQPYRLRFRRTERLVEPEGSDVRVTYRTPVGSVSGKLRYDEGMRRDGITIMAVTERVVKSAADYDTIGFIFEDLEVEFDEGRYRVLCEQVGERGMVVALGNVAASPVHHLLKELVPYDQFYFDLHDHPELIARTAQRMEGYFEAALEACASSSAEVVLFGANYDLMLTPPSVFGPHILPMLSHWADCLHAAGKLLLTHTDGENEKLLDLYLQAGVDVADSVCPRPMTRLSLRDYREAFADRIAIWGGLCSTCVLPASFTDEQFEQHTTDALDAAGDGRGLILSLADTTPPEASLERIRRIGERIAGSIP
ncbi:MAG: hypothetical protein FJX75_23730 [Armatimonadetes bacterium]|nr:hypothetical protein [Armatimonadota bacterium]